MKEIFARLEEHDKKRDWDSYNNISGTQQRLEVLNIETLNMLGEFGEFANELKKARRDNNYRKDLLAEELTDTFIFLLKIAKTLDIDLKEEFHKKIDFNDKRFAHFIKEEKK